LAEYDLIIKALAGRYMDKIASFIRGVEVAVEQLEDKDKEALAVQRTSDVLVKVQEDGYEYLMLVEFQARPDRKMAGRLLEYTAIHHRRYEKPVYPVIINLTGGSRREERYIMDCLDLTVIDFNYILINLEEVAGRELLYRGPVGLLPLAPLMRQDDLPEKVLEKCASRIDNEVKAEEERNILYIALAALSSLKFSKELILRVLEVSKLENLPLFDGIREEWEARARLDVLVDLLEAKFGKVPEDLRSHLGELKSPEIIKDTIRKVVNAETIDEFSRMLKN
jgi:predicted transposase YdaD